MSTFTGQVTSDGKRLTFDAPLMWSVAIGKLKGKRVRVEVLPERARRSDPQNRRYFGVVLPVCREVLNQELEKKGSIFRFSKDGIHEFIDEQFLGFEETPVGNVRRHCSQLSTAEHAAHTAEVERHFRVTYGAVFPDEETVREAGL